MFNRGGHSVRSGFVRFNRTGRSIRSGLVFFTQRSRRFNCFLSSGAFSE
jgi:hypothetical protein